MEKFEMGNLLLPEDTEKPEDDTKNAEGMLINMGKRFSKFKSRIGLAATVILTLSAIETKADKQNFESNNDSFQEFVDESRREFNEFQKNGREEFAKFETNSQEEVETLFKELSDSKESNEVSENKEGDPNEKTENIDYGKYQKKLSTVINAIERINEKMDKKIDTEKLQIMLAFFSGEQVDEAQEMAIKNKFNNEKAIDDFLEDIKDKLMPVISSLKEDSNKERVEEKNSQEKELSLEEIKEIEGDVLKELLDNRDITKTIREEFGKNAKITRAFANGGFVVEATETGKTYVTGTFEIHPQASDFHHPKMFADLKARNNMDVYAQEAQAEGKNIKNDSVIDLRRISPNGTVISFMDIEQGEESSEFPYKEIEDFEKFQSR